MNSPSSVRSMLARHGLTDPPCGVWVGEGWLPIVDEALGKLLAAGWDGDLRQVKEKFGTLRIYIGATNDALHALINAACEKAAKTCECCGDPGSLRKIGGWFTTLCNPCELRERRKRERDNNTAPATGAVTGEQ